MATTPQELLEAAYAKSTKNDPQVLATEDPELLNQVTRYLQALFAAGTRVNLTYFGKKESVTKGGTGWARPVTAEAVWLITKADGTKVHIVPFDDQALMGSAPAVYRYGGMYHEANGSLASVSSLDFHYSSQCEAPATLTTAIDSRWPERFNELLVCLLAYYLAVKDGRPEEYAGLEAQIEHHSALYLAFLEHETVGELRRYEPMRVGSTETFVPLTQLLGLRPKSQR